jgi:predicted CXXCH cytochrome family protein
MKNRRILQFITAVVLLQGATFAATPQSTCYQCHMEFEDEDGPAHLFSRDIHNQKGLDCNDCHGGDPTLDDMDDVRASEGFRGVPGYLQVPEFCARCHSDPNYMHDHNPALPVDQLDKYKTSVHGRRLFQDGDEKVANCVSCHTAHEIGDPKMPHSTTFPQNLPAVCASCHSDKEHMAEYNIPTNQYAEYMQSVHAEALLEGDDLSAPACNDCHGNHGAAPPGVSHLSAVCGQCHAIEANYFSESPHFEAFQEYEFPMCETCHNHHNVTGPGDIMIGFDEPAVCGRCHEPDEASSAPAVIDTVRHSIATLSVMYDSARTVIGEAAQKGMMTIDEEFLLKDVNQAVVSARTAVHAFNSDSVTAVTAAGVATAQDVIISAQELIHEYYYRRIGFLIATGIITILAVSLFLKIRRMERKDPGGRSSTLKASR